MKPTEQSDALETGGAPPQRGRGRRVRRLLLRGSAGVLLTGATAWASAAIWFDGPAARWLAGFMAVGLLVGCAVAFRFIKHSWLAVLFDFALFGVVLIWWLRIPPSNDRDWQADVARLPKATFDHDMVRIDNIRNFDYRSSDDYTEHWESRTYDLDQIVGVDLFLSFWGPKLIAHTIASWEFADGRHLAISIETRKEKGEQYSAVRGLFRQFELYYVVADERDLIGLRTSYRGERVFLYHIRTTPATARALLVDYLASVNKLAQQPRWYNALTENCTTQIHYHYNDVASAKAFSWKILLNGYFDELLYDNGQIDTGLPLAELKSRSDITERAKAAADDPEFSARIRDGLPGIRRTHEIQVEGVGR